MTFFFPLLGAIAAVLVSKTPVFAPTWNATNRLSTLLGHGYTTQSAWLSLVTSSGSLVVVTDLPQCLIGKVALGAS
jgi:hypothetical protein